MMPRLRTIITGSIVLALFAGCGPMGKGRGKTEKEAATVAVETVAKDSVIRTTDLIGALQGSEQVSVSPKLAGRVTQIAKPEGSSVKTGDPIIYVVNDIPGMDYKPGPVLSPIDGVVGKVSVDVGQNVSPATSVATVASYSNQVKVLAPVSDCDLPFVKLGSTASVQISALPDQTFSGRVTKVTPIVDATSRAATVEITVPNSEHRLVPGMTAGVRLVLERRENVVVLPLAALFSTDQTKIIVVDGTTAHFRHIATGLVGDDKVEVVSGVNVGEKVATTGKERVEDGQTVKPIEAGAK
ncbi:MAG TPA: efflux RND transporter periplasmic adaptor subunit [bacterium]|nr:efflux RND transporter periplasmic adaptor subunit [bacterium]